MKKVEFKFVYLPTDGTKLRLIIVFKGAKCEVAVLRQEYKGQAYIVSSANAWMMTELTKDRSFMFLDQLHLTAIYWLGILTNAIWKTA